MKFEPSHAHWKILPLRQVFTFCYPNPYAQAGFAILHNSPLWGLQIPEERENWLQLEAPEVLDADFDQLAHALSWNQKSPPPKRQAR